MRCPVQTLLGKWYKQPDSQYTEPQYFIPELMNIPFDIFIDCGAYTGDTAIQFAHFNPSYEKIYAFEPDRNNFSALKKIQKI